MSAFEVSKTHIDALVSAALFIGDGGRGLTWYWDYGPDGTPLRSGEINCENAREVGAMLWAENAASVAWLYHGSEKAATPLGEIYEPSWLPLPYSAVAVLKAIDCYEWQSCEHPGWHGSEAEAFCRYLRDRYISKLPGYDEAAWAVSHPAEMSSGIRKRAA